MSDKSNKYGYVGVDIPAQSFGANKGVFNPAEINELVADNKWTQYGQLELIETQTASGTATTLDFTSIQESTYNVHFLTINNLQTDSSAASFTVTRLSNNGGSSFISSSYQRAYMLMVTNGTFTENRTTSISYLDLTGSTSSSDTGRSANSYMYFYNLGDSSKYSFTTTHSMGYEDAANGWGHFGSAVYPVAETHNAIRLFNLNGHNIFVTASLYGIRYS